MTNNKRLTNVWQIVEVCSKTWQIIKSPVSTGFIMTREFAGQLKYTCKHISG
jgi:hypothetical protein